MAKHYKIKLEDKAAFLNKLKYLGITVDNFELHDDRLNDVFEFTVEDPDIIKTINTVLKRSPAISDVKERLNRIIKEEVQKFLKESKEKLGEAKKLS